MHLKFETTTKQTTMDNTFNKDCNELYKQLNAMGDRSRKIITDFVKSHGGEYTINIDEDDHVWVGEEVYAVALETDDNGNVLVLNSAQCSENLHNMGDYDILDLARHLNNLKNQ